MSVYDHIKCGTQRVFAAVAFAHASESVLTRGNKKKKKNFL